MNIRKKEKRRIIYSLSFPKAVDKMKASEPSMMRPIYAIYMFCPIYHAVLKTSPLAPKLIILKSVFTEDSCKPPPKSAGHTDKL